MARAWVWWTVRGRALGLVLLAWAGAAEARTLSWTGGGGDGRYANAANWGGARPQDGDVLVFAADGPAAAAFA